MEEKRHYMEFKDILYVLYNRRYLFIFTLLSLLSLLMFYRLYVSKPMYEAKASIIIGNVLDSQKSQFQIGDINNNQVYMQTYVMILKTNVVAEKTIHSLRLQIDANDFQKKHVTALPKPSTQFMEIRIAWRDPQEASLILDTLIDVFIEEAVRIYPTYTIKVLEKLDAREINRIGTLVFVGLSFIASFLAACFMVLALELLRNRIITEEDVERYLGIPVIGTIPKHKKAYSQIMEFVKNSTYTSLDGFRTLRTNLFYISRQQDVKSIVITSARPKEGKSTTAALMAVILAQGGRKTLLIDCDLRKPSIHIYFKLFKTGLSNVLMGEDEWKELVCTCEIENLFILPSGHKPYNPVELISSDAMKEMLAEAVQIYDYVILDTPPAGLFTEAQVLSQMADGYLMVVSSDESRRSDTVKAQRQIQFTHGRALGALLNKFPAKNNVKKYAAYYGK